MYKALKAERRTRKRQAELAADRAVTEATATGSPMRIDDETLGIPLVSTAPGAFAGELINPRGCYICKNDYTLVDAFYHYLCPTCAALSHAKRDQGTDLTGKPRAAHRRPRQDRHVHRAAAAARRRPHHDHDAVPARRRTPLRGPAGQRRLDRPAQDRRHRPARPDPGGLAGRRGRGGRAARHPDQQRLPDGTPHAGLLRAAGRGRARAAADRRHAARRSCLRPDQRRPPGRDRRHPAAARGRAPRDALRTRRPRSPRSRSRPATPAWRPTWPAPRSTPAACCPTCRPRTRGPRPSTRWTRSSCSRCSSATRPRRSS